MSILAKAEQLNNGYFALPYALMGKEAAKTSKTVKAIFGGASSDVQTDNGHIAFIPKGKNRFTTSARVVLGKIHTEEKIFKQPAELSYRKITAKLGHSSRTTASNLKELKDVLQTLSKSTYHINAEYDGKPFFLCYEFLFNEELTLKDGQAPVKLTDLEAIFVSMVVNNKLNNGGSFVAAVQSISSALNIPKSTAQALIKSVVKKGICTCYRQYIDNGEVKRVQDDKAKTKKEKTLITVNSRIIRRCNVIYKEYKKRRREKKEDKKSSGGQAAPQKVLTEEEKFEAIEAKFVQDNKYLRLTERYKELRAEMVEAIVKEKNYGKGETLENIATETFNELRYYLYGNGISRAQLPKDFSKFILNL